MPRYQLPDGRTPVVLSSDSAELLVREAAVLSSYLRDRPELTPDDVASMLMRTRVVRRYRMMVLATDREGLLDALAAFVDGEQHQDVVIGSGPATRRNVSFVFPGQGSQRPGMGRLFYDLSPVFREQVDRANEICEQFYGISPRDYLLGSGEHEDIGVESEDIRIVQPALLIQMVALAQMWRAHGVDPVTTVGHSQGELAAAYISGAMSLPDVIHVVTTRANLVVEFSPTGYSMAVVAIDRDECEAMLAAHSGWAELSVINSAHILCISGDRDTVVEMVERLTAEGKFAREIRVDYPAHTSIVAQFRTKLGVALAGKMENSEFLASAIPCIGGTLGKAMSPHLPLNEYWFWNLRNPVRFDRAIGEAVVHGTEMFVEVAEHPTLMLAIGENLRVAAPDKAIGVIGTSRRTAADLGEFTRNLATVAVSDLAYRWDALAVDDGGIPPLPLRDFPHVQMKTTSLWASHRSPAETRGEAPREGEARGEHEAHSEGEAHRESEPDFAARRIVETWTQLSRRKLGSPRNVLIVDPTGSCSELAAGLCGSLPDHGATAQRFDLESNHTPSGVDSVVILLPEPSDPDPQASVAALADLFGNSTWLPEISAGIAECWLVTIAGESVVAGDSVPQLYSGAAAAGFRCLAAEHPRTHFRHLDLPNGGFSAGAVAAALQVAVEPELAVRDGKIYAKRLAYDEQYESPNSVVAAKDVADDDLSHVVIVGGTGKLGLEFCEHFASLGAERITLLSRSGETAEVSGRISAIRGAGSTEIVAVPCDVGDVSSVLRFVERHQSPPASVIVHAAVNYVDAELADITPELVTAAAAAKVLGVINVLSAVPRTADCRVLLSSSIAATLGGRGQILYAVTNRMLDILAASLREQGIRAQSVQWGLWNVVGPLDEAGVNRVVVTGMIPMRPVDALAIGLDRRPHDSIVAAADWATLQVILSAFGYGPVIGELVPAPVLDTVPLEDAGSFEAVPARPVGLPPHGPATSTASSTPIAAATLSEQVLAELERAMGTDAGEINRAAPLVALGLDSLQALDFRKRVKAALDRDLPIEAILGGASLDEVVALMDPAKSPVNR